eukprot:2495937-Rhodomonas_salina.1
MLTFLAAMLPFLAAGRVRGQRDQVDGHAGRCSAESKPFFHHVPSSKLHPKHRLLARAHCFRAHSTRCTARQKKKKKWGESAAIYGRVQLKPCFDAVSCGGRESKRLR